MNRLLHALIPALALFLLAAGPAAAASVREVGEFADQPFAAPGCPTDCQAVGHVSGYQVQIGTHRNPYIIKKAGKVVAFTIHLGDPDAQQAQFFTNLFGGGPQARLSILKKPKRDKRGTNDLRLLDQSPVYDLANYLGSSPTFALDKPIAIKPGSIIALTVPTWAPAFAINLGPDQAWRSARPKNDCNGTSQVSHQARRKVRSYDCFYRTARLLYSATFIPDPKPTTPQPTRRRTPNRR